MQIEQIIESLNKNRKICTITALFLISLLLGLQLQAFCGFYVAKADASLINKTSQVVLVRHDNKTVISMLNDYEGDEKEFALVIPVPEVLQKEQINVGNQALFARIDAFTAPRLIEYFDSAPCEGQRISMESSLKVKSGMRLAMKPPRRNKKAYQVKVEAEYTVGEYDIVMLSAKESDGLERWLTDNGYKIPKGAQKVLKPYIKQKMKFFVAKVNIKEQLKTGLQKLRPLQFAFEDKKFMLPIRLGMINSNGPQELIVNILTKNGRVETTNYKTSKIPSNLMLPVYVKEEFKDFYTSMFNEQVKKEGMKTVFLEYFGNMGWCDPCAADPLTNAELKALGVFWVNPKDDIFSVFGPNRGQNRQRVNPGKTVKVTRLHMRYTKKTFPADLMFHETEDIKNFQGRYMLHYPWSGDENTCSQAKDYFSHLKTIREKEAQNLASITGWPIKDIRSKMKSKSQISKKWWNGLWD